ncbi:hypothetical protein AOA14_00570 [Sphingopyxis terrae subsp. terrae NBRC 15098]|uniref:Type I restriction modification DNA specificity domain-containing protein n=1 Tax=Sphingopyxis terrae subsp. terrae NBRC 15098 TaxID=1219058 RepID=A0A142VTN9_9SPHN|nr:restriction endonuclease subunit S [Sphingopyxis terrae]AMU93101.1 hypothetical protein AOA14_00570 [Sphingopyxis terrae subsp. terrae NBRC 15098]
MSEWVERPLGKLVSFKKGKKVETSDLALDGFLPYLGASSLTGGEDGFALPNGGISCVASDALMLWDGERSGLVGPGKSGVISSTVMRLRPEAEMTGRYLVHCLRDRFEWIQARRTGTGVPHVPKDLGRILELRFPEAESEQNTICNILDALDTQIEATEGLIAKQERVRAGLMQDLFTRGVDEHGQLRPPRHQAPHLYHQTELGWLPLGWEVDRITKCVNSSSDATIGPFGSNLVASDYRNSGVPVIFVRDVKPERFIWKSDVFVDSAKAKSLAAHESQPGDVIATKMGFPPCIACIHPMDFPAAIITADMIRLRVSRRDVAIPEFVASALNSEVVLAQVRAITGGVTRPKITLADFRSLRLAFPPVTEQKLIFDRMKLIDGLIDDHLRELAKLALQKSGLMQDLLTGKIPVTPLLESMPA